VVLDAPGSLSGWDVASDGRVLLTRDDERMALMGVPPGATLERDLSWFDTAGLASLSPDGRVLLFGDRFGVYLRRTDGSRAVRLGLKETFPDDLSPDGRLVLATNASGSQLMLLPTGAGEARPLPTHGIKSYSGSWWFPDGKHILFNGREADHALRSYVMDVAGGEPRALTTEGTRALSISPDGRMLAVVGPGQGISLLPVSGGPARPVRGSESGDRPVCWSTDNGSLWVFRRGQVPTPVYRIDLATGARKLWKTLVPPDPAGVYSIDELKVTPDGHAYFYSYRRVLSELYVVRGLR
jgi:eukaryotic-like serine/threonine-protein kinase